MYSNPMLRRLSYTIAYTQPHRKFVDITVKFGVDKTATVHSFQLAAWRPGRYELQHYARNIHSLHVEDEIGNPLDFKKSGINSWQVIGNDTNTIIIKYKYFANQMDAGGCWVDAEQLYLNYIACLIYPENGLQCTGDLTLALPKDFKIASGLGYDEGNSTKFSDVMSLFDHPMVASASLQHFHYQVSGCIFNLWFQGNHVVEPSKLLHDFEKFTRAQLALFGEFPFSDYHFIFQILPYRHYHGVEHRNSTVIVLGPAEEIYDYPLYDELLGISSHELFHAWNVCKIRPAELMPYNFSRPALFETGFVAEGFTTYFGDLMLVKGAVFTPQRYLQELNKTLKQHFQNFGNRNLSLANSSLELWVDGYMVGIPHRKVSIYGKGSVVAWLLDLTIQHATNRRCSLDTVIQTMWKKYGKIEIGYTTKDVFDIVSQISGAEAANFLRMALYDTTDLKNYVTEIAPYFGLEVKYCVPASVWEKIYGLKLSPHEKGWFVEDIAPDSPADKYIARKDIILNFNGLSPEEFLLQDDKLVIQFIRDHKSYSVILEASNIRDYWGWLEISLAESSGWW